MLVLFKNYKKKRGIYLLKTVEYLEIRELYPAHVQQNYIIAFIKFNIEQCNKPTLCGEFKPRVQALPIMRVKVTPGGRKWGDVGSFWFQIHNKSCLACSYIWRANNNLH